MNFWSSHFILFGQVVFVLSNALTLYILLLIENFDREMGGRLIEMSDEGKKW